ncbi:MAG: cobalamin-dependent protein [Candidatus Lokiarchaeota archaeon]|nr:cobalamin-dependent protein [Candidatus Lokiarchaeota archaeon]
MKKDEILDNLRNSIVEGISEEAVGFIHKAIDTNIDSKQILDEAIIRGAEEVGIRYEKGEYFLADMLLAADAINECMNIVRPKLIWEKHDTKGKILIGTPEGDIHDIGKSIIIALLQGQGFEIFDLGVDVPPEKFVEVALKEDPDIIALSGLLTVTISKMIETVTMLKKKGIKAKIIVGGGILSEESCKYIGADAWTKDGWKGVKIIKNLMGDN